MIIVNGAAAEAIAVTDRGLAYGDGVFRTLLWRNSAPVAWARQYGKLGRDCAALGIPCPAEATLATELERAAAGIRDLAVKIIVTRGSGARGYAPPQPCSPTRIVMTSSLPEYPGDFATEGIEVRLCRTRVASQPRLAGVKHLNRLENVLARGEWSDPGVPEGLLMDEDGHIVGGTMTNLFLVESTGLVTPALARAGVAGVTRERLMEMAAARGVNCREENVDRERLATAQEVLLVNSLVGVWPVRAFDGRQWSPGTWAARVREWLDEEGR